MIPTGGNWDPTLRHVYFTAASLDRQQAGVVCHGWVLVAVNEIRSPKQMAVVDRWLEEGHRILLDSGIFWLTNEHKRAHGLTMDEALALPPSEIDEFDWLWDQYVKLATRWQDQMWGAIELDQGGMANKRATRQRLHDLGLRPIPVYHPLNDGWDYFDELAEGYDRICWGNVVQAEAEVRRKFLVTAWERHRAYPDLWIHFLGLTPNQWLNAYPVDSADSSTWLNVVRWSGLTDRTMLRGYFHFDHDYQYELGVREGETGAVKACEMSAITVAGMQRGWRHWQARLEEELDLPLYPAI